MLMLTEQQVGSDRCYTVEGRGPGRPGHRQSRNDGEEADDRITVKIGVRDRDETPSVPIVMVTSPTGNMTLEVFWNAKNSGPDISGYDVQYRKGGGSFLDDNCLDTTGKGNCNGITDAPAPRLRGWMRTLPTRCRCGRKMPRARAHGRPWPR